MVGESRIHAIHQMKLIVLEAYAGKNECYFVFMSRCFVSIVLRDRGKYISVSISGFLGFNATNATQVRLYNTNLGKFKPDA